MVVMSIDTDLAFDLEGRAQVGEEAEDHDGDHAEKEGQRRVAALLGVRERGGAGCRLGRGSRPGLGHGRGVGRPRAA